MKVNSRQVSSSHEYLELSQKLSTLLFIGVNSQSNERREGHESQTYLVIVFNDPGIVLGD